MLDKIKLPPRYDQPGYHTLAHLPQRPSVASIAKSTGWWELDQIWKLYPGQFNLITGIPGHGKSTLVFNIVCNMACEHGTKSFLYVPENEQHVRETLALIWGDRQNWEVFDETQCFVQSAIVDTYNQQPKTIDWVLDMAITAIQEDAVSLLVLDPWNEIEWAKPRDISMTDYIGMCIRYLKGFLRKYNCTVILVAHPTKEGTKDGQIPTLYSVEGSAHWYNKVDNGLVVYREPGKNVARVISSKVRERGAGKLGSCYFDVDPDTGIFKPQHGAVG